MGLVKGFNPDTDGLEKTYLTDGVSAGVTSLTVQNSDNFGANDRILIGGMGHEKSEILTVSSATDTSIVTSSGTLFAHDADEPTYELRYDQIKVYRSTSKTGTFSLLVTVDLDVDNAEKITVYDDTAGLSTHWYKISYYHSVSTLESAQSDAQQATGFARGTVGFLIDEILRETSDETEITTDRTELLGWFNEVNDDLQTKVRRPYDFLHTRTTLDRTLDTAHVDFPTDSNGNQTMWKFDRMDYNLVDTTTDPDTNIIYTLRVLDPEEFRNRFQDTTIDSTTVNDETRYMTLDTSVNRFRFNPPFETTSSGVFYLHYWKFFDELNSEGDTFETPTHRPYKLFALGKFYRKLAIADPSKTNMADRYFADYEIEVRKLKQSDRKDVGSPRSIGFNPQTHKGWRKY